MAKSPFFARIRRDVLAIVAAIPEGRLVTFAAIGAHLDVAPRHAAYILAMLDGPERDAVPWHRAVAADGVVDRPAQRERLAAEGFAFDPDGRVAGFEARVAE
ncbi:MAG: MGMT family protein, partial [Acetobacteraceae bacterium]|nr:MGMT family protein [Acetobacteraceae bacterium]